MNRNIRIVALIVFGSLAGWVVVSGQTRATYETYMSSARSQLQAKDYRAALDSARAALALDNSHWDGYVVAASAATGLGDPETAIQMIGLAQARAPIERQEQLRQIILKLGDMPIAQPSPAPMAPRIVSKGTGKMRIVSPTEALPEAVQRLYGPILSYVKLNDGQIVFIADHPIEKLNIPPFTLVRVKPDGTFMMYVTGHSFREVTLAGDVLVCYTTDGQQLTVDPQLGTVKRAPTQK